MPSLREGILKKIFFILFHVRGHGSFPGLIFHIQDVENEPPVLKEIPPLLYLDNPVCCEGEAHGEPGLKPLGHPVAGHRMPDQSINTWIN